MKILSNVQLPVTILIGGQPVKTIEKKDVLFSAEITSIVGLKRDRNNIPYGKAITVDPATGQRIAIMGFGQNAQAVASLITGDVYSFTGIAKGFSDSRFGKTFQVHEVLPDVEVSNPELDVQ